MPLRFIADGFVVEGLLFAGALFAGVLLLVATSTAKSTAWSFTTPGTFLAVFVTALPAPLIAPLTALPQPLEIDTKKIKAIQKMILV